MQKKTKLVVAAAFKKLVELITNTLQGVHPVRASLRRRGIDIISLFGKDRTQVGKISHIHTQCKKCPIILRYVH